MKYKKKNVTFILHSTLLLFGMLINFNPAFAELTLPAGMIKLDGREAPALVLKNMDDEVYDLTTSRGKWVFVHFWATWCGPCRKEMPTVQAVAEKFKDSHLDVVVVNTAESPDTVFSFLGLLAPDINPLMDADGQVTERWQSRGLPATYFVDPHGKLRYLALGGRDWNGAEYIQFLNQLKSVQ